MRYQIGMCLSLLTVAGGAFAQASAPAPSTSSSSIRSIVLSDTQDRWAVPAPASSSFSDHPGSGPAPAKERFKFKEREKPAYVTDSPANPVNKDRVLGTDKRAWEDGRPPVDCTVPPFSPACKP